MKSSFIILLFFCVGIALGASEAVPEGLSIDDVSFFALCGLMLCVGITIGNDREMLRRFRSLNPRIALLPVFTIAGTLVGSLAASMLLPHHDTAEVLAIGSGLGYYSLSSILITDVFGAETGTIALVANILRELITLLFAPLLVRLFGTFAPISAGGATTADTTLPAIVGSSGTQYSILAVYHGCATDFCVPFLVTLFCSL